MNWTTSGRDSRRAVGSSPLEEPGDLPAGATSPRRLRLRSRGVGWLGVLLSTFLAGSRSAAAAEPGATAAAGPWRLSTSLRLPEWLEISGEHRSRYETLDGQFRLGRNGGDQAYALRTLLMTRLKADPVQVAVELIDSREYLSDEGSPIDTTRVDAVDVLQAHVQYDAADLIPGGRSTFRLGRETLDLGNRRLAARNAFRNTINAFTGFDGLWEADGDRGGWVRAFYLLPVRRLPEDRESLLQNDVVADSQSFDSQFAGVYGRWPGLPWRVRLETYYLYTHDEPSIRTRARDLHTPGLRLFRESAPGDWDFEWECTFQFGRSQERVSPGSPELDHLAHFQHVEVGYTWDVRWKPHVGIRYDYASGDREPNDAANNRFDTLYGARRFELGPTGIYGAVARANLNSPEYHLVLRPWRTFELGLFHRFLWLAQARDAWMASGMVDPTGRSGTELGHQVEVRLRWQAVPGNLRMETGFVHLFAGDFIRTAPSVVDRGDTSYAFVEAVVQF
ncbi:MAG: alginate export family protein [Limisphaerales bacterium]